MWIRGRFSIRLPVTDRRAMAMKAPMNRTDEIEKLDHEIRAAFAERPYPGDEKIVHRRPGCRGREAEETWERFRGKDWSEIISLGQEWTVGEDVVWLTLEGFAYYLPPLLILSLDLDCPFGPDSELVSRLWTYPEEISVLLKPAEKRAVIHVLEYLSYEYDRRNYVRNDPYVALDHYWAYFTDAELGLV